MSMEFLDDLTSTDMALLLNIVDNSSLSSDPDEKWGLETLDETTRQAPDRVNSYRRRKREELVRLRQEVEILTNEVNRLQNTTQSTDPQVLFAPAMSSMWRRLAVQQLQARKRSELENATLKKESERQRKLAQQICNLMQKQTSKQTRECINPLVGKTSVLSTSTSDCNGETNPSFAQVDDMIRDAAIGDFTTDYEHISIHRDPDTSSAYMLLRYVRVFPFDRATVERSAVQLQAVIPFYQSKHHIQVWTDEHIVVEYETPAWIGRVEVVVTGKLTIRLVDEPLQKISRFTQTYMVQSDHKAYNGIEMLGEGWYAIRNLQDQDDSNSIVHCVERTTVHGIQHHDLNLFTGMVTQQYEAHFDTIQNELMNAMVRERSLVC